MARISTYGIDTNISNNDQLLGSDAENANITKRFTVGDLAAYINGESPGAPGSGTVTSVSALTLGTSGNDLSSSVSDQTTTPVITLNVPTASSLNRGVLSAADWVAFNSKQAEITLTTTGSSGAATFVGNVLNIPQYSGGSGSVTSVTGTGTVSGITLSGTVTSSGDLTLGGSLVLTSGQITTGLGFTPYNATNPDGFTSFAEPAIFSGGGTPTLASGVTAEEIRTLIGAGSGEGSGTVTSVDAAAGTGISVSGGPITASGTITITNTAPDTGVPAILSNGSVPTLNTGITAEEIRTLIGAGDGTGSIESVTGTAPIVSSGGANPAISISAATTSAAGSMSASDKTKLDGIASGAQVNVATNLSYATATTTGTVASSTGTNATIPAATTSLAGLMTNADKTKLDGIDNVSTNFVKNTDDTFSTTLKVTQIVTLTQAQYDGIGTPSDSTLYIIL